MATLYDLIADVRREHPSSGAARTLDLLTAELGNTRDNLREAIARLDQHQLPPGGETILGEVTGKAFLEGLTDLHTPFAKEELRRLQEPVDESQLGIALLLGGSALVGLALVVLVVVGGIQQIVR